MCLTILQSRIASCSVYKCGIPSPKKFLGAKTISCGKDQQIPKAGSRNWSIGAIIAEHSCCVKLRAGSG